MIVFLYRPSPQVPEPSEQAAEKCFDASVRNVNMQSTQIANKSVDLTWIFTQSLFMALNTILWSLSYPAIRRQHQIDEVKAHLEIALKAINHTSERWPGVQSALQLYENLIQGCLKAYSSDASYVVRSPPSVNEEAGLSPPAASYGSASPAAPSLATHQSPQSQHWSSTESDYQHTARSPPEQLDSMSHLECGDGLPNAFNFSQDQHQENYHPQANFQSSFGQSSTLSTQFNGYSASPGLAGSEDYGVPTFNPHSVENKFPSMIPGLPQWDPNLASDLLQSTFPGYNDIVMDTKPWLGSFGDEYSRYLQQPYYPPEQQMQSLSEQQQLELMAALEQDQLPDVSNLVSDAATFYTGNIL
jgi:hypothetical protein